MATFVMLAGFTDRYDLAAICEAADDETATALFPSVAAPQCPFRETAGVVEAGDAGETPAMKGGAE